MERTLLEGVREGQAAVWRRSAGVRVLQVEVKGRLV